MSLKQDYLQIEIEERLRFETLLSDLSARFVNVPADRLDLEILDCQRLICECLDLDASALWQNDAENANVYLLTHLFRPPGGPAAPERMDAELYFPWCQKLLSAGKVVIVSSLADLPPEAARDVESWTFFGAKTSLTFPLSAGGGPIFGFLSFNDLRKERDWPDSTVKRLQLVAQIFASALARRSADGALRQSEERFRGLAESALVGFYVLEDGRYTYVNPAMARYFGYSVAEMTGMSVREVVQPCDHEILGENIRRRIAGEVQAMQYELRCRHKDGSTRDVEVYGTTVVTRRGPVLVGTGIDITERKRLDKELRRRESQLREAQRIAHVADWTWDPKTDVVTWSDELVTMAGWDPKLPIPTWKQHQQFFTAESWLRLNEAVQKALLTGLSYEVDTQGTHADGTKAWRKIRGEVVRDSQGNIAHLRGTVQDITEHKLADDALRESEERYRSLVESSHDWIWEVDADGRYTYVGPQCRRILGYEPEEILGRKPFDLMPAEEASRVAQAFGQIAGERKPFRTLENVNLHKDGHLIVLETNGTPILDDRGELLGYRGMDRDITRRKRAEEALIQSERKFATLFRTAPAAIGLNTLEGTFVDVNDAFEAVTGYSRDEAIGHTALELGLWVEPDKREELRRRLIENDGVRNIEHSFRTKKGALRTGILSTELIDINGEKYALTVVGDITEQKQAEKIQRELGGRLLRAQEEERKRIARELHDDINQRVALLAVQLQQVQGLPAQGKKQIEKLFKDTTAIASDIQAISHQLHSAKLDYLGLVPAIQGFCDEQARTQRINVKFTHSGVPKSISSDVDLALFRIAQEALHNAVKYSGVKQLEVSLAGTPEYVELVVRDAGVGFGPEAAMHGRGIGLIGMRERIVPLNGKISIVSKPKHGTEITVRVPWPQSDHSD